MACQLSFAQMRSGETKRDLDTPVYGPKGTRSKIPLIVLSVVLMSALFALNCAQPEREITQLEKGLSVYRQNRLEAARPYFERAIVQDEDNPDALAWLAETYRRLRRKDEAITMARKAIAIDRCHSFAHTVLADAYNPHHGSWEKANVDSTWRHLLKAAECDSTDGNVWTGIWVEALRRGDRALEQRALRLLMKTGFLTPSLLAYNRWMLRHLPEKAILLTNGDMDTYPAVALQQVEKFRTDVVVVNIPLLDISWYARLLRDRHDLPLPLQDSELDSLDSRRDDENEISLSKQIIGHWLNRRKRGVLSDPIAVSVTVVETNLPPDIDDHLKLAGAFWLWLPEPTESTLDTAMIQMSLHDINPDDFAGSLVSSQDRSPVRMANTNRIVTNVTAAALQYGNELIKLGHRTKASEMIAWAEQFEAKTALGPFFTTHIEQLKETVQQEVE